VVSILLLNLLGMAVKKNSLVEFEVLTAVVMKGSVFWDI
jgi:hypothetical protein